MKIGSNTYKLILLDTNALREIVTNTKLSGKGFLQNFFSGEKLYAPCFSIYNVIELMPYENIYKQFLDFFSTVPCLMIFPAKSIIQEEYRHYINGSQLQITNKIANVFTPLIDNNSYNCKKFFNSLKSNDKLMETINAEISGLKDTANEWEKQRHNTKQLLESLQFPKNMFDENFYTTQEKETITKDLMNWGIVPNKDVNISKLPALRIMEYSQFNRLYLTHKNIKPNDVMDITISSIIPYIDAVITENFQANIYKKAKRFIPQLKILEIYTLKDIRQN